METILHVSTLRESLFPFVLILSTYLDVQLNSKEIQYNTSLNLISSNPPVTICDHRLLAGQYNV